MTVDQSSNPPKNACLVSLARNDNASKIIVEGGSFISPNGYGYAAVKDGQVIFEVSGDYKKLFKVKELIYHE